MLTEAEIESRLPIWYVLSDVFLDNELQPQGYSLIAHTLRNSPFPLPELRRIFEFEVAPALLPNLMQIAGEWAGWSRASVREIMVEYLEAGPVRRGFGRLARWQFRLMLEEEWAKIVAAMERPPPESWLRKP